MHTKKQTTHDPTAFYLRHPKCDHIHIPHCEPGRSDSQPYTDTPTHTVAKDSRIQPNIVEEYRGDRPPPSSWSESPCASCLGYAGSEPVQSMASSGRTPSSDHHVPQLRLPVQNHSPCCRQNPHSIDQIANRTAVVAQQFRPSVTALQTFVPPAPPQPCHTPQPRSHKTEKEKMLHGEPFLPHDEQLTLERTHCTDVVRSFNSTASPSVVIARGDRERNFKRITTAGWIHPRYMGKPPGVHVGGYLGRNVNVTTPFHCDYGYNISIGDNVSIGPHCQLFDSARIEIGRDTKLGARVTISTLKTPTDTQSLKGSDGAAIAREVFVGENVYIADGVIIEAGVRIGSNAIIRAGSVVVRASTSHGLIFSWKLTMCRISKLILSRTEIQHSDRCLNSRQATRVT
jgi:acetyltransferase-like isoleucine patch superfamily enzyme